MFKFATNNIVVLRHLKVRPRLTVAATSSYLVFSLLLPEHCRNVTKFLVAWDSGTLLYLLLAAIMMHDSDSTTVRKRAALQDDGSIVILGLTVCSAIASLVAIMASLPPLKGMAALPLQHVVLTATTVVLTWLFMQTMFCTSLRP